MRSVDTVELSVIIPSRFEPLIGQTIQGVLSETGDAGGVEIIVVGSGDWRTLPDNPRVRVIDLGERVWSGVARNRGLKEAQGLTVAFLDADCVPQPGWLAGIRASQREERTIGCAAIATPLNNFWQDCYNVACFREYLEGLPPAKRRFLPSHCLWGPREAFDESGGFDETWPGAEDLDLTARLARAGWNLRFCPSARVLHCPASRSFWRMVKHGWAHGGTSYRARYLYPEAFGLSQSVLSPVLLLAIAPLAAGFFLARTWWEHPRFRPISWRGAPAIFAFRFAWCLGAAWSGLHFGRIFEPVTNA